MPAGVRAGRGNLDEADKAHADSLASAREYITKRVDEQFAEEEPEEPSHLPAVEEVDSLNITREGINTIVWATGYAYDYNWVKVPVFDDRGRPIQQRGVSTRPSPYFLGLHWMHTFKSGLLSGVGADAEFLADHIDEESRAVQEAGRQGPGDDQHWRSVAGRPQTDSRQP